jgi:hypothetical protein
MISAARYGNCSSAEGRKKQCAGEQQRKETLNIEKREGEYVYLHIPLHSLYHLPVNQTHIKTTVIQHTTRLLISQKLHDDDYILT